MNNDERLLKALLELALTLGVVLVEARQIGYLRALEGVPIHSLEWACIEVLKHHEYPTMPVPAQLIKLAAAAPRLPKPQHQPYNSSQIAEYTVQSRDEAKEALQRLMDGLDSWDQAEPA
jgi:hypothetical protein